MLNPPLSLLPDELLDSIVEHVAKAAKRSFKDQTLNNLSLADRAFTQSCQKYIFRNFKVIKKNFSQDTQDVMIKLERAKKLLDDKPSIANQVRMVQLAISRNECAWFFNDPTFISILQLLAKSPLPPHELHLSRCMYASPIAKDSDSIHLVRRLARSFFPQTLTILHLSGCESVPLHIFLICPRLRIVSLNFVGAEMSYDEYPDNQCSGREPPPLEELYYHDSHNLVKQMITPPSRFNTPVVLWSSLRILTATSEKEEMACLQPILDAACNTLEELYLMDVYVGESPTQRLPLAGLVNLNNVSRLHVFSLKTSIECNGPRFAVVHNINIVLGTIRESNRLTNLFFLLYMDGCRPFHGCLDQDWDGMYKEVIRISDGKPLEVDIQMEVIPNIEIDQSEEEEELYMFIMDKAGSLSDYPKVCTHFWNPFFWDRGLYPFPYNQVRSRCRPVDCSSRLF